MKLQIILFLAFLKNMWTNMKLIAKLIARFFNNCYGWCRSVIIVKFLTIKRVRVLYGYDHYELAKKLCHRRNKGWKDAWDQLGKTQSVFPYGEEKLLICSPMEMKFFQKRGYISGKKYYTKIVKTAYYSIK